MKIVITNGPPRSGKDTMCGLIRENIRDHDLIPMSYKKTLYVGVARRYGLSVEAVFQMNDDTLIKDEPSSIFGGKSVRQALIFESEEVIKKQYGPQGVAVQTFKLLEEEYGKERLKNAILYCSDGGFNSELRAAYDYFDLSVEDVFIMRMLREGCSFKGDSREFLKHPDVIIHNDSDMDHLKSYMDLVQLFCDGYVTSTSRTMHMQREYERKTYLFLKKLGLFKVKKPKTPKVVKDRNKAAGSSKTLSKLMSRLHAK